MDFFGSMDIAATGLAAQRTRMNTASSNLANALTTHTDAGGPYKRHDVVLATAKADASMSGGLAGGDPAVFGVKVEAIREDKAAPRLEYDPGHPDANAQGYVAYPNVSPVEEMVDMITASRAYETGITSLSAAVSMAERALTIGK